MFWKVLTALLFDGLILTSVIMSLLWCIQFKTHNAAIVDVGWAASFAWLTLFYVWVMPFHPARQVLLLTMVSLWSLRLALHLFIDRVWKKPEDPRYHLFREKWKTHVQLKFFLMFQFQALLAVCLSLPFLIIAMDPGSAWHGCEAFGLGLWLLALAGESVSDAQLKRFKSNPSNKGKTCQVGLWHYSRHPNYFFEWLTWVAFFAVSLGSPWGWLSLVSPVVMLYLLLRVSGIPMTEAQALKSRGDEYRDYQRTTSMFVPWFRKVS